MQIFVLLKVSAAPAPPPPLQNPAYATDLKQYVKTFLKDQLFLYFRAQTIFLGSSQLRNQEEGLKATLAAFSQAI